MIVNRLAWYFRKSANARAADPLGFHARYVAGCEVLARMRAKFQATPNVVRFKRAAWK